LKEDTGIKKGNPNKSSKQKPGFEESLNRLEDLIKEMEASDVVLEDLLEKYAEGVHLIQNCRVWLNDVQNRFEEIKPN